MKNKKKRLSLDAFKSKAQNAKTSIALDKITGGNNEDCHVRPSGGGTPYPNDIAMITLE